MYIHDRGLLAIDDSVCVMVLHGWLCVFFLLVLLVKFWVFVHIIRLLRDPLLLFQLFLCKLLLGRVHDILVHVIQLRKHLLVLFLSVIII